MNITKKLNGNEMEIALEGRLDTMTAPQLEAELGSLDKAESLVLDCTKLDYISSAGLRVLLAAHKIMCGKGGMKVELAYLLVNVNHDFGSTGCNMNLVCVAR